MIKSEILVPLLNANEPEARLAAVHVKDGQAVEKGALLFTIETTKAASDIESPEAGFARLLAKEGDTLAVGDRLAVITEKADEPVEIAGRGDLYGRPGAGTSPAPTDMRITKPARTLAESLGVDLAALPTDRLVTEDVVRQYAGAAPEISLPPADQPYILIYGGGGHAKSIMEMVKQLGGYAIAGIVDDSLPAGTRVLGIPVLGTRAALSALTGLGVRLAANGVGGILDINVRVKVFELLEAAGFAFPALVHPRATVEPSAQVGEGVQVFANAYVGAEAELQPRCMVNTNAVVSHDCVVGAYTHIAPGALLAGHVHVGGRTLVGMGVTTAIGVRIGSGVRIGNGAIVLADVPDRMVIQAGRYWVGKAETPK
ncbi:MAG: hexapeptide transferase [Anaerolineaceae bacterium]|nr:MAG: hexapeptide transferase [Anaerolineaceae bacterium]